MTFFLKRGWNEKPSQPKLNLNNDIAKKLDFYAPFGAMDRGGLDIVGNLSPVVTGTTPKGSKLGVVKDFTGDAYLNYGNNHNIGTGSLTVGVWFKTNQTSATSFINKSAASSASNRWIFGVSGAGDLSFAIDDGPNITAATPMIWGDNKWHFAVGVLKRGVGLYLYVDGVEVAFVSSVGFNDLTTNFILLIGKYQDSTGLTVGTVNQFIGQLSDPFISHEAFLVREIKSLYSNFYQIIEPRKQLIPTVGGTTAITGSGTLQSSPATLTGTGKRKVNGVGVLLSGNATLAGVGLRVVNSSGILQSGNASLTGFGLRKIQGVGALQSGNANITGIGLRTVNGIGALFSGSATITGNDKIISPTYEVINMPFTTEHVMSMPLSNDPTATH